MTLARRERRRARYGKLRSEKPVGARPSSSEQARRGWSPLRARVTQRPTGALVPPRVATFRFFFAGLAGPGGGPPDAPGRSRIGARSRRGTGPPTDDIPPGRAPARAARPRVVRARSPRKA